jgi:CYTH domain-containing protein
MAKETERKFLVREEILIPLLASGGFEKKHIKQYYLVATKEVAVRVRLEDQRHLYKRHKLYLTVKAGGDGLTTNEFEFRVAETDTDKAYRDNLRSRQGLEITKTRHLVPHGGRTFEVDVFGGELEGLVVAELEADDAAEVTNLPQWIDEEVTFDPSYKNALLALQGAPAALSTRLSMMPSTFKAIRELNTPSRMVFLPTGEMPFRRVAYDETHDVADRIATSESVMKALQALDFNLRDERHHHVDGTPSVDSIQAQTNAEHSAQRDDFAGDNIIDFLAGLLETEDDIIMIGEITDPVSLEIARQAKEAGYKPSSEVAPISPDDVLTKDDGAPISTKTDSQKGN